MCLLELILLHFSQVSLVTSPLAGRDFLWRRTPTSLTSFRQWIPATSSITPVQRSRQNWSGWNSPFRHYPLYLLSRWHCSPLLTASAAVTGGSPFTGNCDSRGVQVQSPRLRPPQKWEPTAEPRNVQTEDNSVVPHQAELWLSS